MTPELQRRLTWEEATERFLDVAELKAAERPGVLETAVDKLAWAAHNTLTGQTRALNSLQAMTSQVVSLCCVLLYICKRSVCGMLKGDTSICMGGILGIGCLPCACIASISMP